MDTLDFRACGQTNDYIFATNYSMSQINICVYLNSQNMAFCLVKLAQSLRFFMIKMKKHTRATIK